MSENDRPLVGRSVAIAVKKSSRAGVQISRNRALIIRSRHCSFFGHRIEKGDSAH
jgi:hypothetical protein